MRARRTMGVVAVLAAVAVGQVVTSRVPVVGSDDDRPFVHTGGLGDTVHLSYADAKVTDVRPAHYLASPISTHLARMAGGVWVLVSVTLTASTEPITLENAWLVDPQGRYYRSSTRSECAPTVDLPTGLPTYALFCFDVPSRRLAGLHLRLARGELDSGRTSEDDLADVDLAVSTKDAATWARTTEVYGAVTSSLEPFELESVTLTETTGS